MSVLSKMNLIVEPQFLRDHNVSKMNQLPQVDYRCDVNYFVYFVSPTKQVVDQVAESVRYVYAQIYSPHVVKILSMDLEGNLDTPTSPMYGPSP